MCTSDSIYVWLSFVCAADLRGSSWPTTKQLFLCGAAYGTKCYLQRIISILKDTEQKKKFSVGQHEKTL